MAAGPAIQKVSVTKAAVIRRINRKLREHSQMLKIARTKRARNDFGHYYVINTHHDLVVEKNVDLQNMARGFKVLAKYERIIEK